MKSFRDEIHSLDRLCPEPREIQEDKIIPVRVFGRKYEYFKPHCYKLDKRFLDDAAEIEGLYKGTFHSKPDQVRVEQWVRKLCENCCGRIPLMKNRNKYIKLLKMCIEQIGRLEGVFKRMPDADGDELKLLQNHEVLDIEYLANNNKKRKKSQKRAKEMYQFNQLKAKQEMAGLKNAASHYKQQQKQNEENQPEQQYLTLKHMKHNFRDYQVASDNQSVKSPMSATRTINVENQHQSSLSSIHASNTTMFSGGLSPLTNKNSNHQRTLPGSIYNNKKSQRKVNPLHEIALNNQKHQAKTQNTSNALDLPKQQNYPDFSDQNYEGKRSRRSRGERLASASISKSSSVEKAFNLENEYKHSVPSKKQKEKKDYDSDSESSSSPTPMKNLRKGLYIPKSKQMPSSIAIFNRTVFEDTKRKMKKIQSVPRIRLDNIEERKSTEANSPKSISVRNRLNQDISFVLTKRQEQLMQEEKQNYMKIQDLENERIDMLNELQKLRAESLKLIEMKSLFFRS